MDNIDEYWEWYNSLDDIEREEYERAMRELNSEEMENEDEI
jgi:hypothetical protein